MELLTQQIDIEKVSKSIRKFVNSLIENEILLLCIGGESYIYGITNKYIKKIYHYTNSRYIYNDCEYNNKFYKKDLENNHIDYNDDKLIIVSDINVCLINLSNLTKNLINKLDKNNYKVLKHYNAVYRRKERRHQKHLWLQEADA